MVDGNAFAATLLRPTINGVVVPTLSIALGTLLATTVNVLRDRQVLPPAAIFAPLARPSGRSITRSLTVLLLHNMCHGSLSTPLWVPRDSGRNRHAHSDGDRAAPPTSWLACGSLWDTSAQNAPACGPLPAARLLRPNHCRIFTWRVSSGRLWRERFVSCLRSTIGCHRCLVAWR